MNAPIDEITAPDSTAKAEPSLRRTHQRGMTLIEIMVVLVIIGMISGIVGVAVFGVLDGAKVKATKVQMSIIGDALAQYRLISGKYPPTSTGLTVLTQSGNGRRALMESIPKDGWDNDYVYIFPGTHNSGGFDILSYGEDGVSSSDDIGNWKSPTEP